MIRFVKTAFLFGIGLGVISGTGVFYVQAQEEHPTPAAGQAKGHPRGGP